MTTEIPTITFLSLLFGTVSTNWRVTTIITTKINIFIYYRLTTSEYVITVATDARIGVPVTVDVVGTLSTVKPVVVVAALDGIVAVLTIDEVFAAASVNTVVAIATIDGIVAAAAFC